MESLYFSIINGLIWGMLFGVILGLVPLVTGMKKNQPGLAVGGFFGCIVAGAIGGMILGIPVAALFWWLIRKSDNKSSEFKD